MIRAQDIMSRDLFVLDAAASGDEARWALSRRRIGGAPVADGDGKEATVEDVMTPSAVVISMDDPIEFAAQQMVSHDIHRVVVIDDVGRPVGVVTAMDIVRAVADRPSPIGKVS
jgi:CBS domain-containing protein